MTITNSTDLIQAIRAGQSVLPRGDNVVWKAAKIPSIVSRSYLVDLREKYRITYDIKLLVPSSLESRSSFASSSFL